MKQIATLAGVSIGTVDRVLHQRGRVSAENVARIQALVADHGYKPNLFASRLSGRTLKTVGVALPMAGQDAGYWSQIRRGMERAAAEFRPLHVQLAVVEFDRYSEASGAEALERLAGSAAVAVPPIQPGVVTATLGR